MVGLVVSYWIKRMEIKDMCITNGIEDPVFNGIFIDMGCECDGYNCHYCDCDACCDGGICKGYLGSPCYIKKNQIRQQILYNQEVLERIKNMTVADLNKCYTLYDRYWDDGLNDDITLEKIKILLLENKK